MIFTNINEKKNFLHALIKTYTFTNFWETFTYTIIRPCTIIWQVTLCNLKLLWFWYVSWNELKLEYICIMLWKITRLLTLFYEKLFLTGYILSLKKLSKSPLEVSAAFLLGTILGLKYQKRPKKLRRLLWTAPSSIS